MLFDRLYLNAGQMKAGTTFLYKGLARHPGIHFTAEKEIHYLSEAYGNFRLLSEETRLRKARAIVMAAQERAGDLASYRRALRFASLYLDTPLDDRWYRRLFWNMPASAWAADFSNLTCTIPFEGLQHVRNLARDVRVTYCLRDPVERAFSHAKFHLKFAGAEADLSRMAPAALRRLLLSANVWPQSESRRHVEGLRAVFGPSNLRIIRCEAMWSEPAATMAAVCRFLDLDPPSVAPPQAAVNVGPPSGRTAETDALFEEIFAPLREDNAALLAENADIVI